MHTYAHTTHVCTLARTERERERDRETERETERERESIVEHVHMQFLVSFRCLGTTQHLKNKYGSGYSLEIKLGTDIENSTVRHGQMERLNTFIMETFPNALRTECFAERAVYKIPQKNVASLAFTFRALENGRTDYNIEEYSFSQSTLEQVRIMPSAVY